jgi:hypothetical protein
MRRILIGAAGILILATVVTAGAIAMSSPKAETFKGGWGQRGASGLVSAPAPQGQEAPSQAGAFDKTKHVILRQKSVVFIDSNPKAARGDQLVVQGSVLKPGTTHRIGLFSVRCQLVAPHKNALFDCNATFNLHGPFPAGRSITSQGWSSNATTWTNAITGGTGRYANVTGQVHLHNIRKTNDIDTWFYLNHVR